MFYSKLLPNKDRSYLKPRNALDTYIEPMPDQLIDRIYRLAYQLAYKLHIVFNYVFRPKSKGAYIALWYKEHILLIKNSYKSVYTIPCGGIEKDETSINAAIRELKEETGINLSLESFKMAWQTVSYCEYKKDTIYLYEVNLKKIPKIKADGREVIWLGFKTIEEAFKMPLFFPIKDYLRNKKLNICSK